MKEKSNINFLIAGGGTGGHVFPAIAIANALRELHPQSNFLFMGAKGKIEMIKVPEAGYQIIGLPISGLQRGKIISNLLLPFKIIYSLIVSFFWIIKFKPSMAIGVGGYASLPPLWSANFLNVPVVVQEQNAFAGLANKIMRSKAMAFFVAYNNMEQFFPKSKIYLLGNPIRQSITQALPDKAATKLKWGFNLNDKVILVVGGSLGAQSINNAIAHHAAYFQKNNLQLIWQTGPSFYQAQAQNFKAYSQIKILDFIKNMDEAYSIADLIITRAGAGAIAELCVVAKPAILIPSPNVTDDHQTKNAQALQSDNAALMIADHEVNEKLIPAIESILHHPETVETFTANLKKNARPDAAKNIASMILKIVQNK